MRLRVGRGSFTWDSKRYNAGDLIEVPDDDPRLGALRRLYGLEPAPARRRKQSADREEVTADGISET